MSSEYEEASHLFHLLKYSQSTDGINLLLAYKKGELPVAACLCGKPTTPQQEAKMADDFEMYKVYEQYPGVTFTCIAYPAAHETGCRCGFKDWTRADLLGALLVKKKFEQDKWEAEKKKYERQ